MTQASGRSGGPKVVRCDAAQALFEEEGRGDAGGEGEGVVAELGLGVEEDGLVDQTLGEEGAVDVGAGFDEEAGEVAAGELLEHGGEAEVAVLWRWVGPRCRWRRGWPGCAGGLGAADDEEIVSGGADELGVEWECGGGCRG